MNRYIINAVLMAFLAMGVGTASFAMPATEHDRIVLRKDGEGHLLDPELARQLLEIASQSEEPQRFVVQLHAHPDYNPLRMGADPEFEAFIADQSERDMDALARELQGRAAGQLEERHRLLPLPLLVYEADEAGLQALIDANLVQVIYENVTFLPFLADTLPIIQAASLHSVGGTGSGHAVAVLDSGIQRNHPMFSGKIVGEACFASDFSSSYPGCPAGHNAPSTAPGASETCTGHAECSHGTHVSGIAVGSQQTVTGTTIKGVAPSANLVSIRAGTLQPDGLSTGVRYRLDDTITALTWVYNQRNALSIAAVNMSYGAPTNSTGYCDSIYSDIAQQVDLLSGAGVAVIAASGNIVSGVVPGTLASPACIENVISVGAVKKDETFADYSSANPTLDLLAPGGYSGTGNMVLSAVPGSSYDYSYGTSMAAPHIAGSFAGLRNLWPKADTSVATILQHLKDTGTPISITQGGNTFSVPLLKLSSVLAYPTATSPLTVTHQYCYGLNIVSWPASSGTVTHYELQGSSAANFLWPVQLYSGSATSTNINISGTTWVRGRSCHGPSCSPWTAAGTTADYYPFCL